MAFSFRKLFGLKKPLKEDSSRHVGGTLGSVKLSKTTAVHTGNGNWNYQSETDATYHHYHGHDGEVRFNQLQNLEQNSSPLDNSLDDEEEEEGVGKDYKPATVALMASEYIPRRHH